MKTRQTQKLLKLLNANPCCDCPPLSDAEGNIITCNEDGLYASAAEAEALRFGVSGEDDTATENRDFSLGAFNLELTGNSALNLLSSVNAGAGNAIYGQSADGFGLSGVSQNYHAVSGISTNSRGGSFESTGDLGIYAQTISGASAIVGFQSPSSTNTVVNVIRATRFSTGTAANGIGGSLEFQTKTTINNKISNQLISKWTDATDATRTSEVSLTGVNSATLQTLLTISGAGIFTLTQGLQEFADDAAAAAGSIPVNGLYRTASVVKIRVS